MAKNTTVDEMAIEIVAELKAYSEEVAEEIKKSVKQVAKETVNELKSTSPKKTGVYAKGWKSTISYESNDDIRITVHNSKKPQIVHLLENGHAKVNGGRVNGIPHVAPAEEKAAENLVGKAKVAVKVR